MKGGLRRDRDRVLSLPGLSCEDIGPREPSPSGPKWRPRMTLSKVSNGSVTWEYDDANPDAG